MKITFFTQNNDDYISGGRQYAWHMAHCLANAGHKVLLVTNRNPLFDRDYEKFPGRQNIELMIDSFFYGTRDQNKLKRIKDCDFIMCSPMTSTDIAVTFGKQWKKKIIAIVYEPYNYMSESISRGVEIPMTENIIKSISDHYKQILKCDMILCNNELMAEKCGEWLSGYRGKISYLYNSFNTHVADKVLQETCIQENSVVYCSRTVIYKGFGYIPLIFGQTKIKPKIYYITGYVDTGNVKFKDFIDLCKTKAGLDIEVLMKTDEETKFRIMRKSKALFFPSKFEGFGLPPAESLYMGTPVVSFDLDVLQTVYKDHIDYVPLEDPTYAIKLFDEILSKEKKQISKETSEYIRSFAQIDNYSINLDRIVSGFMGKEIKQIKEVKKVEEVKDKLVDQPITNKVSISEKIKSMYKIEDENTKNKIVAILNGNPKFENSNIVEKLSKLDIEIKRNNIRDIEGKHVLILENDLKDINEINIVIASNLLNKHDIVMGSHRVVGETITKHDYSVHDFQDNKILLLSKYMADKYITFPLWYQSIFYGGHNSNWTNCRLPLCTYEDNFYKKNVQILGIICVGSDKYIPKLYQKIKAMKENYNIDFVISHHEKDGKYIDSVLNLKGDIVQRVFKLKGDFNYSRMNNFAFDKMSTEKKYDFVLLMNDDINPAMDSLQHMLDAFKMPNIGVVGSNLILGDCDPDLDHRGKIQHAGVKLLKDKYCSHIYRGYDINKKEARILRKVDAVTFAYVLIDFDLYKEIRLDEELPNDFNDIDFCIRASQDNYQIYNQGKAICSHRETVTRRELNLVEDSKCKKLFKERHKETLSNQISYSDLRGLENNGF